MCTIPVEALTPLDRTSRIKMYKNIARSRLFCRIAKRSIKDFEENGKLESSESRQRQGVDLQSFEIFKTTRSVFFQAGNRQLSHKFPEKL